MALTEEIILTDPVLQRIMFDKRTFAAKHGCKGTVNNALFTISQMKVLFLKARSIVVAERLQREMRAQWFVARLMSDGYYVELPAGHDDGCEHVAQFEHGINSPAFDVDFRKRATLWYRYERRPAPRWPGH